MARKKGGLIGIDTVTAGLNSRLLKMKGYSAMGLSEAVTYIRRDMEKTPPLVPIGKSRPGYTGGNLRASWTQKPILLKGKDPGIIFGFTANYAFWVHEMIGQGINWSRPGSGPKFMQAALNRNVRVILKIIGESVKK